MKKLFYPLTLLTLLFVQVGCESHHKDDAIQEEQEQTYQNNEGTQNDIQKPHIESEHGSSAGNK